MAKNLKIVSYKRKMSGLITVSILVLSACGNSESPQVAEPKKQQTQMMLDLERRMALMAVGSVTANISSMQDMGDGQSWTTEEAAGKLASFMNSAQAPGPDDPKVSGPKFTYVANQASGPWQVVIKVEGEALQITAYGSSASQPLEQRTIPLSSY